MACVESKAVVQKLIFSFRLPEPMEVEVVMWLGRSFRKSGEAALNALEPAAVPTRETARKVLINLAADSATCSEPAMIYLVGFYCTDKFALLFLLFRQAMDSLDDFIKRSLPNVSEADRWELSKHLQGMGAAKIDDLIDLTEDDIVNQLKPLSRRRFLKCIKNGS